MTNANISVKKKLSAIGIDDIRAARKTIQDVVLPTEMKLAPQALDIPGSQIYLKFENEQLTGSFKIRGALNKMKSLNADERKRGVVASSAGNHAQGVAFSAKQEGIKSHIVMPTTAPIVKISATKSYGAEVILQGDFYDEAFAFAQKLENEKDYIFVHPYQDEKIIAGQGTIGLEMMETVPDLDTIVVPIGGGGLISGIATAAKALNPNVRIVGVVSDQAPAMMHLFKGEPVPAKSKKISTIAEGIAVKNASAEMFEIYIRRLVDEIVCVSDDEIARAIVFLLEKAKTVTEGSGAAGLAAVLSGKIKVGKKVGVVLCGGNIDLNIVAKVIERGQRLQHRLARFSVVVDDLPGNLSRLTGVMADQRANILEVHHDRVSHDLGLRETRIDMLVETISDEHIDQIHDALLKVIGCRVVDSPSSHGAASSKNPGR